MKHLTHYSVNEVQQALYTSVTYHPGSSKFVRAPPSTVVKIQINDDEHPNGYFFYTSNRLIYDALFAFRCFSCSSLMNENIKTVMVVDSNVCLIHIETAKQSKKKSTDRGVIIDLTNIMKEMKQRDNLLLPRACFIMSTFLVILSFALWIQPSVSPSDILSVESFPKWHFSMMNLASIPQENTLPVPSFFTNMSNYVSHINPFSSITSLF